MGMSKKLQKLQTVFTEKEDTEKGFDRKDKNTFSDFVIEKHLLLNNNYQITSEYDVQLSRK